MKKFILFFVLLFAAEYSSAQFFTLDVNDNGAMMHQMNSFHFTKDSLVITARADYGRSVVDYLKRALTAEESKQLQKFLKTFPADSLKEEYYNEYTNLGYIDAEHFPRSIELIISKGDKTINSKATNAYVSLYAKLFDEINKLLPVEVKIKFNKDNFNAFY